MNRYFGTDGMRGRAGDALGPELALRAAFGFTRQLGKSKDLYHTRHRPKVVVGSDCRLSSPMLKSAAISGLALGGCDAIDIGIVPTPLVSFTVLKRKAAGGVMLTASHNPIEDNGIKFFGGDGIKITPKQERAIEKIIAKPARLAAPGKINFGKHSLYEPAGDYLSFLQRAVRVSANSRSLRLVLDCAHGASSALAPEAFTQAGFSVRAINAIFNGRRINVKCGATDLRQLSRAVKRTGADLGLAFDGDGDRVLAVDHLGRSVSGDRIIALLATRIKHYQGQGAVVMTHMTNLGVELALKLRGIKMHRVEVGDANVLAAMMREGLDLGGEQAGHVIMRDKLPAGDGILTGLRLAALLRSEQQPLSALVEEFPEYPQVLTNLRMHDKLAWQDDARLRKRLSRVKADNKGVRFYLRPSGTEDVVRVLTEAEDSRRCRRGNLAACEALQSFDNRKHA